jgi:hypothetical protein
MIVGSSVTCKLSRETAYGAVQRHIRVKRKEWGRVPIGILDGALARADLVSRM